MTLVLCGLMPATLIANARDRALVNTSTSPYGKLKGIICMKWSWSQEMNILLLTGQYHKRNRLAPS